MKLFSALLCLCFVLNGLAATGSVSALDKALDQYQFALTVEWDQRDQKVYQAQTQAFFVEVARLMRDEGLTTESVVAVVEKKAQGRIDVKALKLKLELLSKNANSSDDLARLLSDNSQQFYQRGASWDGEVALYIGLGVLFAAALAYTIWWNIKYECVDYDYVRDCDWIEDSDGDRDYRCGYDRKCVQWVERNPN